MSQRLDTAASDVASFYRPPERVMRLSRMGSAHPMRLSFLRILLRRVQRESWQFERTLWEVDARGVGRAVYRATGPERSYSLVVFAHDLHDDMRSDRVIATAWDATFTLFDGAPTTADLDRLQANVPLQEAGRVSVRELALSRANRSVRLFNYVVDALSEGKQPDIAEIAPIGYLMRTTAVYGSGKFGAADRSVLAQRPELAAPFQAEMLTVWLIRWFTIDIVNHMAKIRGKDKAVQLAPDICRTLGVGNSTGLGMAPFLVRHPLLLHTWISVREEALARVRACAQARPAHIEALNDAAAQAVQNAALWRSEHPLQVEKLADLRRDLEKITGHLTDWPTAGELPWNTLWMWGEETLSEEGQEALLSLMLEPHGALIDELASAMSVDESLSFHIDGRMTLGTLRGILRRYYAWALSIDFDKPEAVSRFWYVSEEKLEPRLGERFHEDGATLEQPLCIAWMAQSLFKAIENCAEHETLAAFLLANPEHRYMVRRAQQLPRTPYAEVHDNLIAHDMLPIDLMRCKLALFGASHFDPRSDKWVRINLFRGEAYPLEMNRQRGAGQDA